MIYHIWPAVEFLQVDFFLKQTGKDISCDPVRTRIKIMQIWTNPTSILQYSCNLLIASFLLLQKYPVKYSYLYYRYYNDNLPITFIQPVGHRLHIPWITFKFEKMFLYSTKFWYKIENHYNILRLFLNQIEENIRWVRNLI